MIFDEGDIGRIVKVVGGSYAGADARLRYRVRRGHPKDGPEFDVWRVRLLTGTKDRPDKAGITTSLYSWKLSGLENREPNLAFRLSKIEKAGPKKSPVKKSKTKGRRIKRRRR